MPVSVRTLFLATRPMFLTASLMPAVVGELAVFIAFGTPVVASAWLQGAAIDGGKWLRDRRPTLLAAIRTTLAIHLLGGLWLTAAALLSAAPSP